MSFPVRQAKDLVNRRVILMLAALGVLVVIFASAVPAWMLESRSLLSLDAPAREAAAPAAPREINIVDQTLLEATGQAAPTTHEQQRQLLERYGWVDRARGVVRIPIERAMRLTLEERAP